MKLFVFILILVWYFNKILYFKKEIKCNRIEIIETTPIFQITKDILTITNRTYRNLTKTIKNTSPKMMTHNLKEEWGNLISLNRNIEFLKQRIRLNLTLNPLYKRDTTT